MVQLDHKLIDQARRLTRGDNIHDEIRLKNARSPACRLALSMRTRP